MSFKHRSILTRFSALVLVLGLSACSRSAGEFHYTSHVISGLKNQVISICAEIQAEQPNQSKQFCKVGATDDSGKLQVSLHGGVSDFLNATARLLDVKFFALVDGKKMEFTEVDTSDVRFFDHYADGKIVLKL